MTSEEVREDIRRKGEAARQLLSSDFYVTTINDLANHFTLAMCESEEGDAGRRNRDEFHTRLCAVAEINRHITGIAQQLDDLEEAELREAEEAAEQLQDIA